MDVACQKGINACICLPLTLQRLAYIRNVELAAPEGRLPVNVGPSLLQTKLKQGICRQARTRHSVG
jgi:hypothetical protein